MNELQGLVVPIEARIDKLEKGLARANRTQRRSAQQMERRAKQSADRMRRTYGEMGDSVGAGFKKMALPLLAGVASIQTVRQIAATTRAVAQLGDEAKRSGVPLKAFQEWKFVAEQNRIGVDQMIDGLKELNLRADEFVLTGKGPAAEAFARLGYGADELRDKLKDPSALLLEVIGRMERLSKSGQIRVADEIFGGSAGERFVELIDRGEDGLRQTVNRAHELGLVLDDSVVARADELDRKFNALMSKVTTLGKRIAVATADVGAAIVDDIASIGDVDPLAGLTLSYSQLEQKARMAGVSMMQSVQLLSSYGYDDVANEMRELSQRTMDLVDGFADGTVEGAEFSAELETIQAEAQAAFDRVEQIDRADFPNVTGALAGLGTQLLQTLGVAQSLKGVLDAIDGASGPSQMQVFREADAESMRAWEADQQRRAEFMAGESTRNSMTQERLDLEREITAVQKSAADSGVTLTRQQAEAAAQARITADAARRAATTPDRPASTSGGGGGSVEQSDWDAALTSLAEETAALKLEAEALLNVTGAQIQRGDAMALAQTKAELLNAALRSGMADTPALRTQIEGLADEYVQASNSAELAASKITEVQEASQRGANSIANVFEGMATGALTAKEAVGRLIIEIIKLSLKKRLLETASNAGGWLGKIIGVIGGGFSEGGYTGDGGKMQPAGVVHKGEYVMSKSATRAIGVGNLEALHSSAKRGYSGGGLVGGKVPIAGRNANAAQPMAVNINAPITVEGSAGTPEQNDDLSKKMAKSLEGTMRGIVVDTLRQQLRNGNMLGKR